MSEAAAAASNSTALSPVGGGVQLLSNIQGAESYVAATLNALLVSLENFAISVGKDAVIFLIIAGVLLYYSRLSTLMGKRLVEGGIVIGVFITFVVPYLTVAYC